MRGTAGAMARMAYAARGGRRGFPMTSYRRSEIRGKVANGLSYLRWEEGARHGLRMQFTLGRERWVEQGAHYRLAVAVVSTF